MISINTHFVFITVLAALAALALSVFWYSPRILGNSWLTLVNLPGDSARRGQHKKLLTTFVAYYAIAVTLFILVAVTGATSAKNGFILGAWVSLGLIGGSIINIYVWENRLLRLFLITCGNLVFCTVLMSTMIGHLSGIFFPR